MNKQIKTLAILFCLIMVCFTLLIVGNRTTEKVLTNEVTGTTFREKIVCLPESKITREFYKENGISLLDLPKCEDYKIVGKVTSSNGVVKDNGIFSQIFIRPLTWCLLKVGAIFNNYLFALLFLITIKGIVSTFSNYKQYKTELKIKSISEDLKTIGERYNKDSNYWTEENPYNETISKINYADDLKHLYKLNNIKPASGCLLTIIQFPILIAFINILYSVPVIFESSILGITLGINIQSLIDSNVYMLTIPLALFITTFLNSIIITSLKPKKINIISGLIVSILITIASFSFPIGLTFYFIASDILNLISKIIVNRLCK